MSWEVIRSHPGIIQVVPENDLLHHSLTVLKEKDGRDTITTSNCHCRPRFQFEAESIIIIHRSYDLREALEQIHDILNGEI